MIRDDFAAIIISHGRPNCETVKTLRDSGYTGKIFVIADDEDKTLDEYKKIYKDFLHVFHKQDDFDTADNFDGPKSVGVYARNECIKVARKNNLKYYLELDDDMQSISYRYEKDGSLKGKKIKNFDDVLSAICDYFDECDISCLGFGNATDYIGGLQAYGSGKINRVIFNAFFMRTVDDMKWFSRHTDDLISQMWQAIKGKYYARFIPVQAMFDVWLGKKESKKSGGSIQTYNDLGSYVLRYYAVMFFPSCVKLKMKDGGFDFSVVQNNAYPRLVSQKVRK